MARQSPHVPFFGAVDFNTTHLFLNTRSKFINHLMDQLSWHGAIIDQLLRTEYYYQATKPILHYE